MNIDTRKRFREGPHSKAWHDITASNVFASACEAALILTVERMPKCSDMTSSAANDWRVQGARLFIDSLANLTEPEPTKPPTAPRRLDHKV
jgi:hypothetical protein